MRGALKCIICGLEFERGTRDVCAECVDALKADLASMPIIGAGVNAIASGRPSEGAGGKPGSKPPVPAHILDIKRAVQVVGSWVRMWAEETKSAMPDLSGDRIWLAGPVIIKHLKWWAGHPAFSDMVEEVRPALDLAISAARAAEREPEQRVGICWDCGYMATIHNGLVVCGCGAVDPLTRVDLMPRWLPRQKAREHLVAIGTPVERKTLDAWVKRGHVPAKRQGGIEVIDMGAVKRRVG